VSTLKTFAKEGIPVITDNDFIPSEQSGIPSQAYCLAPSAVHAHLHKSIKSLNGVILHESAALKISHKNIINLSIAPKKGKPQGRLTINPSSNSTHSGHYLNSDSSVSQARILWGDIRHPTILEFIQLILKMADKHGFHDLVIWKLDLAAAFSFSNVPT
jgi:hypothetical protein